MDRRMMIRRAAQSAAALALASRWDISAPLWGQYVASGRIFDPRKYGARGDGRSSDTQAIQNAINDCTQSGGGTVRLGPGTYVTGTITIKSNVTLELQAGAKILASNNYDDFLMPPEGVAALKGQQGKHLIFAVSSQNVALIGPGTIDGNSPHYVTTVDRPLPRPEDQYRDVASFGMKRLQPISPMVEFALCNNVRVENITLQNAVGWDLHPVACTQVLVRGVKVRNPINSSNTDGIDPCSCSDVLIDSCDVITGDDGIDVKTLNPYSKDQISKNVAVTNCRVTTDCNGLKIGAEGVGDFENINFSHCEVYSANGSPLNERVIGGISIEMAAPHNINGVTFDDITMNNVRTPIFIRLQKPLGRPNAGPGGSIQNVKISNVRATGAILTSSISGLQGAPVGNITLSNIQIQTSEPGQLAWAQNPVKENEASYAESTMFGRLPSYGFYLRHAKQIAFQNVSVSSVQGDPRPMLICEDVSQLTVQNVSGTPSDPSQPFIDLRNTQSARIQGNRAPAGTGVFVKVSGANSHDVQMQGNDLSQSKSPVMRTPEVPQDAVGSVN